MGVVSETQKCENCGANEFFVDTLGIEHCSKCYMSTMNITEATGRLSFRQIELEKNLEKERQVKKHGLNKN